MTTEDIFSEGLSIELLGLNVESWESVAGMRNVETTITSSLHGTKDSGTSGGFSEANIEMALEWASALAILIGGLGELEFSGDFLDTSEELVKSELLEGSAGKEEAGGVSGGPVGETVLNSVSLELVGVGSTEDLVALDVGGDNLADDLLRERQFLVTVLSTVFRCEYIHHGW